MDNQDAIRRRLIARSRRYVDTLMDLADRVVTREDLPYDPDDPASFMIRGFASKQHDHLHSVRILVDAGQDGDATIIARTMLEGVAQLVWALRGQPGRPALWWWYAAIMDWRQLKKNEQEGLAISPEQWQGIDQLLGQHGRQYYTREAQTKVKKGRTVPADPYRWWWHDVSIREIFEEVGGKEHYKELYGIASERIHWNPRSMLRSLDIVEGIPQTYLKSDPRGALAALMAGFLALHQSLELLDRQFDLGLTADLESLLEGFSSEAPENEAPI